MVAICVFTTNQRYQPLLLAILALTLCLPPIGAEEVTPNANDNAQQNATDPLDHVGRGLQNGATLPFGGLQWDPNKILWLYGAGCGRPDMLKIIPRSTGEGGGAINIAQEKQGTPGYWRGVVGGWRDPAIIVEQTVSYRSGIARYLFNPALEPLAQLRSVSA